MQDQEEANPEIKDYFAKNPQKAEEVGESLVSVSKEKDTSGRILKGIYSGNLFPRGVIWDNTDWSDVSNKITLILMILVFGGITIAIIYFLIFPLK